METKLEQTLTKGRGGGPWGISQKKKHTMKKNNILVAVSQKANPPVQKIRGKTLNTMGLNQRTLHVVEGGVAEKHWGGGTPHR